MENETKINYEVLEDEGGRLYLAIFDSDDNCTHFFESFEKLQGILVRTIADLKRGYSPDTWGGGVANPQQEYNSLTNYRLIEDQDGTYPERMGNADRKEYGLK